MTQKECFIFRLSLRQRPLAKEEGVRLSVLLSSIFCSIMHITKKPVNVRFGRKQGFHFLARRLFSFRIAAFHTRTGVPLSWGLSSPATRQTQVRSPCTHTPCVNGICSSRSPACQTSAGLCPSHRGFSTARRRMGSISPGPGVP